MTEQNEIESRVATDAELMQARELFEVAFKEKAAEERWRYKYFDNPAGPVVAFAAFDGGKLVSVLPSHPSLFSVFGEEVTIYQSGDIMTHPGYRRRGIYNRLKEMSGEWLRELDVPFTIGFPNANALEANRKYGYHILGGMTRWFKILEPGGESAGQKALSYAAFPILSAIRRKVLADNVAQISSFPDEVSRVNIHFPGRNGIYGKRDAVFLNWRYPDLDGDTVAWIANPDSLDGYLVAERSTRGYWIRDLAVDPRNKRSIANLLGAVTEYAENEGARHIVFQYLGKSYNRALYASGFVPMPGRSYVALYPYAMDKRRLSNKRSWYLADADRDMEF